MPDFQPGEPGSIHGSNFLFSIEHKLSVSLKLEQVQRLTAPSSGHIWYQIYPAADIFGRGREQICCVPFPKYIPWRRRVEPPAPEKEL